MTRDMHSKVRDWRAIAAMVLGIAMAAGASAVESTATKVAPAVTEQVSGQTLDELAEVWVRGKQLSTDIETAENDFFRRFNKKNKKGLYDIHCGLMSLLPGSMIMRRVCVPGYAALSESTVIPGPISMTAGLCGSSSLYSDSEGYNYSYSCGSSVTTYPTVIPGIPLALLARQHSEKFIDNLLHVTNSDPQLLERAWHLEKLYREMLQVQLKYADIDVDEKTRQKVEKVARKRGKSRAVSTRVH